MNLEIVFNFFLLTKLYYCFFSTEGYVLSIDYTAMHALSDGIYEK